MAFKKGYITFILFFYLAAMLLLPTTTSTKSSVSLSPAYGAQATTNMNTAFKRTLAPSAQYSYNLAKPFLQEMDSISQISEPLKFTLASSAFTIGTQTAADEAKKEIIRVAILSQWQKNINDASTNDYLFEISCRDYTGFARLPAPQTTQQIPALWDSCASHISFYEGKLANSTIVALDAGIFTKTTHRPTNTTAQSELFAAELK